MLEFFVKKPVTTVMFVMLWVVLGFVAYPRMNIEASPAVDFPMVTATFVYPGASPIDMESQIIKRAEDAITQVAGVKKITSQAFENSGFIMTEFDLGVNVSDKAAEVKEKIDGIAGEFPIDMKKPVIEKLNPLQESVIDVTLTGAASRDLELFARDRLSPKITGMKGIAGVTVFGGNERAIRVFMNPDEMASRGVTVTDIVGALAASNLNLPGGRLEMNASSDTVRFVGEFQSVREIENLQISTSEGGLFKLADVASVSDSAVDVSTGARYNGNDVVIVSVIKANDGNAIKISHDLRRMFPEFQNMMTEYFNGDASAKMEIISDSSIAVADETNSTLVGIILGMALTVATLLIFTRNWRSTIIASVVIPASLVAGFFFIDASGFTINAMTLLACATALGTLIANAIVLIESALGLLASGAAPERAAIDGTKKMVVPIMASTGTNLVVFLPIAFMGGIAGQFMMQFGLTVVYLTILSLMFSFTLTPMMIAKILRKTKPKAESRKPKTDLSWYKKYFDYQIAHPWRTVGLATIVLILSAIPLRWVGNEFAPSTDVNEINISARAPVGSTYAKSEKIAKQIEEKLAKFSEVEYTSVKIGERGTQNIKIRVGLIPHETGRISDKKLAQLMLPEIAMIPDAEIQIRAGENMSDVMSGDLTLNIVGDDDAKRAEYAAQAVKILNQIPEIQSAILSAQAPGRELKFIPDNDKMKFWGVANASAAMSLRTALYGNDTYKYKEGGLEFPILLEFDKDYKTAAMFENIYVNSMKGMVPLSTLGKIESAAASPEIKRIDKNRITEININIGKSTIGPVRNSIDAALSVIEFAPGYGAHFSGMTEMQDESTAEMSTAFILASLLTFMVLAAIMNSLRHPFTVATSILYSFAGVFVMMFLTGASINIAALLSVIMLVGLVVNNNILVLEPAINEIRAGKNVATALWEQFLDKKRMLLMTTVAVAAGMVPQLWSADGMKLSMGAVIIGGMCASLFWTFAMTPAMFAIMQGRKKK